jgi:putative addiction module component (TIGR02574 family)
LGSLDGPADPDPESAWDAEIERRIAAIEAGTIQLEPWEQVRHRIEKDILGR